jgi:hypothetical protein
MQLGSSLVGAAAGAMAGGTTQSAALGQSVAVTATTNNMLLHPDQIQEIARISGGDTTKANELKAVLCYLQNCQIDGTSGNTGDASTQALYKQGQQLRQTSPALYGQLVEQITSDPQLLMGSNSYGWSYGNPITGTANATADFAGQEKDSLNYGLNMVTQVVTPAAEDFVTGAAKGVGQLPIDALNTGPTAINGYGNIYQAAIGQPLSNIVDPLSYPDWLQPQGDAQQAGSVAGKVAVGAAVTVAAEVGTVGTASSSVDQPVTAQNFFDGTQYTPKVLNQAASGDYHSFPSSVDAFSGNGTVTQIVGGDGVTRSVLTIPGSYNGQSGVFEYIRNPDDTINHRLFVPGK